jgi:hypothetical protein
VGRPISTARGQIRSLLYPTRSKDSTARADAFYQTNSFFCLLAGVRSSELIARRAAGFLFSVLLLRAIPQQVQLTLLAYRQSSWAL